MAQCSHGGGFHGLEIFVFLLFLVYLLQFLNDVLMNANFMIMINGQNVTVFEALLLALLGLYGRPGVVVNNNNNNNNNVSTGGPHFTRFLFF